MSNKSRKNYNNFTKISQGTPDEIEETVTLEEPVIEEVVEENVIEAAEDIPTTEASEPAKLFAPYNVKVSIPNLNIRKGPGFNYDATGRFTGIGTFEIVDVREEEGSGSGWGRLSSGEGWISLDHTYKV